MRTTEKHLNLLVTLLNTGHPAPGLHEVGSYTISYENGGVSLYEYVNDKGAVHDVFNCGHVPKKDLHNRIKAFLDGFDLGRQERRDISWP